MFKDKRTYVDFNGTERTEEFYFNLTKAELIELEISHPGGLVAYLDNIVKSQNVADIVMTFKEIMAKSYGVKSDDGRQFIKSDGNFKAYTETEAYSDFFMELSQNADKAAAFVKGIIPSSLSEDAS